MKKLLVFTENYARGGGNRYLVDLVNALSDSFEGVVIASNRNGLFPEDVSRLTRPAERRHAAFVTKALLAKCLAGLPPALVRLLLLPMTLLEPLLFALNVLLSLVLLQMVRPTAVVSCNGGYPGAQAALAMVVAADLVGIPVMLSVVSMPRPRRPALAMYDRCVDFIVVRSASLILVNAAAVARGMQELRGMPPAKVRVVHNGLEDSGKHRLRPFEGRTCVIGCVARMDREKGVIQLLEAFGALKDEFPGISLILAGDGNASAELTRRVREERLEDRVTLLGHYPGNVEDLICSFDLYAFPSLWEGFPYSILEALRAGCTIVATDVGGIPEAIRNGVDGLIVEPGSSTALANAIRQLLGDEGFSNGLAHNAKLRFERDFSLETMHRSVQDVMRSAGYIA